MLQEWELVSGKSKARLEDDAVVFVHAGFAPSKVQRESSPHSVAYAEIMLVEFKEPGRLSGGHLAVATHNGVHPRHLENPSAFTLTPGTPDEKLRMTQFAEELLRRSSLSDFGHLTTRGLFQSVKAEPGAMDTPPPMRADSAATSKPAPPEPSGRIEEAAPGPGVLEGAEPRAEEASPAAARPGREVQVRSSAPVALIPAFGALLDERARSLAAADVGIEQALRRFKEVEKEAAPALRSVAKTEEHTRIMSIGMVRQVTLYDLHIQLPRSRVPMSTQVYATAENQGTKQVMRGSMWTGPQTADRREMWLHVTWPEGFEAVHWQRNDDSITGASVKPAQVHEMAAAINRAAQRYPEAAAQDARYRETATRELAHATAPLRVQVTALLVNLENHVKASTAVRAFVEDLSRREDLERRERRTAKDVASRAGKTERSAREALERGRKLLDRLTPSRRGSAASSAARSAELTSATVPALGPADQQSESAPSTTSPAAGETRVQPVALTDLLAQLGQLRDAGVLTEEEFTAKKTDILNRL